MSKSEPVGTRAQVHSRWWLDLAERSAENITITISASGISIPPDGLPHLFERFHRGRNASDYVGNSLGLAIVKAIVNLHDGNVVARSKPKQGRHRCLCVFSNVESLTWLVTTVWELRL